MHSARLLSRKLSAAAVRRIVGHCRAFIKLIDEQGIRVRAFPPGSATEVAAWTGSARPAAAIAVRIFKQDMYEGPRVLSCAYCRRQDAQKT
jgi:hypothetical protein